MRDIEEQFEYDLNFAKKSLLQDGYLRQMVIGWTEDDKMIVIPFEFRDEHEKELRLKLVELFFLAHGVVRYTNMSEVWFSMSPDGTIKGKPSEDPNRKEGLIVFMISHDTKKVKFFETIRDQDERIVDLVFQKELGSDQIAGRMTELLPPKEITSNPLSRKLAEMVLRKMGVDFDALPLEDVIYEGNETIH